MFSIKALIPVLIAIHFLFGGLVLVLIKGDKSARFWLYGCLSLAFGLTLVLLRGVLPDWLTYSVANLLTLLSWFLFYISLEILICSRSRMLPWALFIVTCHGVVIELIMASAWKANLVIYLSAVWSVVSLILFFKILKFNRSHKNRYIEVMAYLFLGFSIVWGFHILLSLNYGLSFVMDDKFANWLTMLANTLLALIRQMDYFAIRYSFVDDEKSQVEHLLREREALIANLLKANKTAATGALSASIAHELNQPLGASNLNIQFLKMQLKKGALSVELGKEVLDSLEADNQRAATIVGSLRSIFAGGESKPELIQLGDSISKVLNIVKPELKVNNIQIQLRAPVDCMIYVNPSEIEQVILNLVSNAMQSLANSATVDRHISIEANRFDEWVQLSISDNGSGIPKEFKDQLFELLNTTKKTGMGLGLWLCKHIVTRYGGSIHCEDILGGGAKFVVRLPSNHFFA